MIDVPVTRDQARANAMEALEKAKDALLDVEPYMASQWTAQAQAWAAVADTFPFEQIEETEDYPDINDAFVGASDSDDILFRVRAALGRHLDDTGITLFIRDLHEYGLVFRNKNEKPTLNAGDQFQTTRSDGVINYWEVNKHGGINFASGTLNPAYNPS